MTAAVITVSDSVYAGARADKSGPAVRQRLESKGWSVPILEAVPDESDRISSRVQALADSGSVSAIFTTGGTGIALRDVTPEATRASIEHGLTFDLLVLSGGVSAGKYDLVEIVLAHLGAEFFFDRVLIQPGQPLVFGRAREKFFFGLPGNPASTMVTFELFARAALELLGGQDHSLLPITLAPLAADFRHKPGLTRFLPALLSDDGMLTPVPWQGSSDVPALARSNAFLIADANREQWKAGETIQVLLK